MSGLSSRLCHHLTHSTIMSQYKGVDLLARQLLLCAVLLAIFALGQLQQHHALLAVMHAVVLWYLQEEQSCDMCRLLSMVLCAGIMVVMDIIAEAHVSQLNA